MSKHGLPSASMQHRIDSARIARDNGPDWRDELRETHRRIAELEGKRTRLIAAAPEVYDLFRAAVARVEIANAEGNPILSGWLADARALLARIDGRE